MAKHLERCVLKLKAEGKSKAAAFAICNKAVKLMDADHVELEEDQDFPEAYLQKAEADTVTELSDHRKKRKKKKKKRKVLRARVTSYSDLETLNDVEILRVVDIAHRGLKFDAADLAEIQVNTQNLIDRNLHNPPGKLGHDDEQKFAKMSGLPAIGWMSSIRLVGDRLLANFEEVPRMFKEAVKNHLYQKVSSEIYHAFEDPETGENMGQVIRAVAFLGADVPQVKGLAAFLKDNAAVYQFDDADKAENFTDVTINITMPDDQQGVIPELPPSPEETKIPLDPEKLSGLDLEFFRQAEAAVELLKDAQIEELEKEQNVDGLVRWVGRIGFDGCMTNSILRGFPSPEGLCSWLWDRALERGLVVEARPHILDEEGEDNMGDKETITKLEEELVGLKKSATSSDEEKATLKTKLSELEDKAKSDKAAQEKVARATALAEVETFASKKEHEKIMTPALKMELSALAEAVGTESQTIKLDEDGDKTEKIAGHKLLMRFAENLIKAKVVHLEEMGAGKKTGNSGAKVSKMEGADYADLDEKAQELVKSDARLSKLSETAPNTAYIEAVKLVSAEDPELNKRGE